MCLAKLRVSYEFNNMCRKSHKKLQGYLKALLSKNNEDKVENLVNSDLNVVITPLRGYENEFYCTENVDTEYQESEVQSCKEKRKRITKEQRCSLLKRLLSNSEAHKRSNDRYFYNNYYKSTFSEKNDKGGLRNIINFTKNYKFGGNKYTYKQSSPLDKLKAFSEQFFKRDFEDFKNTILYIIENKDNLHDSCDSEDDLFDSLSEEEPDTKEGILKFEEVIVEPDLKIKTELDFEDEGEYAPNAYYGEYGDHISVKKGEDYVKNIQHIKTDIPAEPCRQNESLTSNSMQILNNFVGNYSHKRMFYSSNVRCRTRENPYINPMLKEQFLYRSFKCDKCSRYFKSHGYLKAHYTKIH